MSDFTDPLDIEPTTHDEELLAWVTEEWLPTARSLLAPGVTAKNSFNSRP